MKEDIDKIINSAMTEIKTSKDTKTLEEIRIKYLGKKGELTEVLKTLGKLSAEERPKVGALVNDAKNQIESEINKFLNGLKSKEMLAKYESEKIDITLKGRIPNVGTKHPLRIVQDELEDIFLGMGFTIESGPEIETDYYNFKAMNFEDDHPARDSQDTLYINEKVLFRTHTSPVQARTMEKMHPNPVELFVRDVFTDVMLLMQVIVLNFIR